MRNSMKNLAIGLSALIIGASPVYAKKYPTIKEAMKVLGISSSQEIELNLPEGYKTSRAISNHLRVLAGIYAGTVQIKEEEEGHYSMKGSYSQFRNPESMIKVLREADTNKDKIITFGEEVSLSDRILNNNLKK